ncbi:MAG TPA: hypothetical protein VJ063_17600 [Verrucomicrobiae bacterium]|nr:hypothetical protein [Verrucomicrobiae bacterium]
MKIVFIADEFKLRTAAQQLLDRFLMGYPTAGRFHKPECRVTLITPEKNSIIEQRIKDFGLEWQPKMVTDADAAMIFTRTPPQSASWRRSFAYAALFPLTHGTGIGGTAVRGAWLLPDIAAAKNRRLATGLVIAQGPYPMAELESVDALLPLIWREGAKLRTVTHLAGNDFWSILKRDYWPLVKSAISRSDSPQGDAVRDGRTEDLARLGLLEGLVKSPRGWLVEHADGFRYVIAVMDGAVNDYNLAVQTRTGGIISAQVHRGPPPEEHHYSRLAALLEKYFSTGVPPWPRAQGVYTSELMNHLNARYGERNR